MTGGRQTGFSLIELAIVLVIIGLLVGGGIAAISATTEQTQRSAQKRQFDRIEEALYGFAMAEGRLPFPDRDGDGAEDTPSGSCADVGDEVEYGALPSADLGLRGRDAWGNSLFYAVTCEYADEPVDDPSDPTTTGQSSFTLDPGSDGRYEVYDDHDTGTAQRVAFNVPAVILTFGPQGGQVWVNDWPSAGIHCPGAGGAPPSGFSDNETENCNNTTNFVWAGYAPARSGQRFDDMLMWLSDHVLKARMVRAGKLP